MDPLIDSPRTYECDVTIRLPSGGFIRLTGNRLTMVGLRELWKIVGQAMDVAEQVDA